MKDLAILLISCLQKNHQENERSGNFVDFLLTKESSKEMKDLIILVISCLQKHHQENERSDNFGDFLLTKELSRK